VSCTGQAFAERDNYFGKNEPAKVIKESKPSPVIAPPVVNGAGEDFGTATPIPSLPFGDTGDTCGFVDDYFPACAVGGNSTAPDLVYSYRPTTDQCVNIDMCGSSYDTIVHVYDSAATMIACNDDFCGLQSTVENVALVGGQLYYIVVDGWSTRCGAYDIQISECPPPCDPSCPPGSYLENEPVCGDAYVDATNGGCNSVPPVFSEVPCDDLGLTVCGTYGTYISAEGFNSRDTDWYQIVLDGPTTLDLCVCGSLPTQLALVNGTDGCDLFTIACGSVFGGPNETVCCQATVGPGTFWVFVSVDGFSGYPCGQPYRLTINGNLCPPVSAQPADWSRIKSLYR
jgi:hypothetical protein